MNNENKQPIEEIEETNAVVDTEDIEEETLKDILADEGDENEEIVEEEAPKKVRSADKIRRLRHGRVAKLITVGVIVAVLLLNVVFSILGSRFPLNLDLTSNKLFSLSDESRAIAASLTEPVEIVVFSAEEVFSDINSQESIAYHGGKTSRANVLSEFYNATKRYNQLTGGKVTVTYIDMNRNPTLVSKYSQYKDSEAIQEGDILFISAKQNRVTDIGTGLFTYDPSEYYSSGQMNVESIVEQTLATNLKAVQSETEQVITFAVGYDEDDYTLTALQNLYTLNGYTVEQVNLTRSTAINPNTVCMVIPAPSKDYSTETMDKLRDWLSNDGKEGRNLMVFIHPTAVCENLEEFLKVEYGMEVTENVVAENNLDLMYQYNPYYPYASIAESDYTASCGGGDVLAPLCRQIIPHWEEQTDKSTRYSVNLVTFSEDAQVAPMEVINSTATDTKLQDYDGTVVGMAIAVKDGYQNALQTATSTKVGVCGSSYLSNFTSMNTVFNDSLLLDSMTKITGVTNSVNISSKSLTEQTISFPASVVIGVGLIFFVILCPLSLLVTALIVFLKRRHL